MFRICFAPLIALLLVCQVAALDSNLQAGCISDYDPAVDYFPDKIEIEYAEKFALSYHGHYKLLTVSDAFDGASPFVYALLQCGAPAPPTSDLPDKAQIIEIPARDLIALSTTQLPPLIQLGLLGHLVGVDSAFYSRTPEIVAGVAAGNIAEVGFGSAINIELVLSLQPDLALTYGFNPDTDAHPILLEAGVNTALDASWRETSPLGRAEWLKFVALFYNREVEANALFADIAAEYHAASALTADLPAAERPAVLLNSFLAYADAWFIPGAESYAGQLLGDAGMRPLLSEPDSRDSKPHSFEAVYEAALEAEIWLLETFALRSLTDLLALDSRFGDFAAFQAGNAWNNNADENANGGNNIYEWGVISPHLVLRDLIAIAHPHLLPDHEFAFYRRLTHD